jgi:hypothetical protein
MMRTFNFDEKRRYNPKQEIWMEVGHIQDVLRNALPQQVMHTLLAHELRADMPRWIEAGAGFMEQGFNDGSNERRGIVNERRPNLVQAHADGTMIPLAKSFLLRDYPTAKELPLWYLQSESVCRFLVDRKDRGTLLAFVKRGMERGWDDATRRYYGFDDVAELEVAWRKSFTVSNAKAFEPDERIEGEILKVQLGELSVSILIDANKKSVHLTREKKSTGKLPIASPTKP